MKRLQRLWDGAQRRFEAHDRRWKLLQRQRGSVTRMRESALVHLRWAHAAERAALYEAPRVLPVGNMRDLLAYVPRGGSN